MDLREQPSFTDTGAYDRCTIPELLGEIASEVRGRAASEGTIVVRPVIDTNNCTPVDSWEIPERLKTRVRPGDHTCRSPHCTRPAQACDLDHCEPWAEGGATCPCHLVPLCRRHHRAKTFSPWRYSIIEPGHYLWTSPHGRHWHVGPAGTRSLDPTPLEPDEP